jgi:hypothetical protein
VLYFGSLGNFGFVAAFVHPDRAGRDGSNAPNRIVRAQMHEEIGTTAGAIWQALNTKGELSLPSLKQEVEAKSPVFDWAVGWLARENKVVITRQQKSYRVRLNEPQARTAGA